MMFYHDSKLQYTVRCDNPNPIFAKMLQQAIGGVEGEIRVALQYMFQAWATDDSKYRGMLMDTGAEELAHIEMLATAVTMNLRGAPSAVQESIGEADTATAAILSGMSPRHFLSAGMNAMPTDSEGNAFDASHVYASGNLAADMYANVTAESTGRLLACRLYEMTDDPGMKDMLSFLIARDTMHQNQWLAALEELSSEQSVHPIPNSFNRDLEKQEYSYKFISTQIDGELPSEGRWTTGPSIDGRGSFSHQRGAPVGQMPQPDPQPLEAYQDSYVLRRLGISPEGQDKGVMDKLADSLTDDDQSGEG
jgi:Mn-containing catalase